MLGRDLHKNNRDMECIGIDVSKKALEVAAVRKTGEFTEKVLGTHTFENDGRGLEELLSWAERKAPHDGTLFVMEATGTYYELAADYLHNAGKSVVVELPNKIKAYSKVRNVKTKTDRVDAKVIASYGLNCRTRLWKPMTENLAQMRSFIRQSCSLVRERTACKNQLHALEHSPNAPEMLKQDLIARIETLTGYIEKYQGEALRLAAEDTGFYARAIKVASIKGVRILTVLSVLCETNGFSICDNVRQAVSYAGLDISLCDSGSFKSRGRISKRGNARIRQALYLPAITASHYGPEGIQKLYARVADRHPDAKKVAIIAAERKLYTLIYTLWKKNEPFKAQ